MATWLIASHYVYILDILAILLALSTLYVLAVRLPELEKKEWAVIAVLIGLAVGVVGTRPPQAQVYNDEFFYVAIAENIRLNGRCEPLVRSIKEPLGVHFGFIKPPYPQGWPWQIAMWQKGHSLLQRVSQGDAPATSLWTNSVGLSQTLLVAAPIILFLALRRRFSLIIAAVTAALVLSLPFLLKASASLAAENGAFFALVLAFWAFCELKHRPVGFHWLWLVLAASWLANMRPECLILAVGLIGGGAWLLWKNQVPTVPGVVAPHLKMIIAGGLIAAFFCWPTPAVMFIHPPQLDHHFEALPRPNLSMNANRLANLNNNLVYFFNGKIWPWPLTVLGMAALAKATYLLWRRSPDNGLAYCWEVSLYLAWGIIITAFLSWFPFGDYGAVHSFDTWRFAFHIALPGLLLSALGWEALAKWRIGAVMAALLALIASLSWFYPSAFLRQEHPLHAFDNVCVRTVAKANYPIVVEAPELYCYLHDYLGLEVTMASPADLAKDTTYWLFLSNANHGLLNLEGWEKWNLFPEEYETARHIGIFEGQYNEL